MSEVDGEIFQMYLGLPGSGKSLNLLETVILPALRANIQVYVNFWVNWRYPNLHLFNDISEIIDVRNAVVVFDEIGNVLEPRNWENEDTGIRKFFQQHRKRHNELYGNTQHISLVAKSALIVVDKFIMCDKSFTAPIFKRFLPWIVCHEIEMTLKEIKLEDSDYVVYAEDQDEQFEYSSATTHYYNKHKLLHLDLFNDKDELVHFYCPSCKKRQGDKILKTETLKYATLDKKSGMYLQKRKKLLINCPKHVDIPLEIHNSGMYDTDYEIMTTEKQVEFVPFYNKMIKVRYKGSLTQDQIDLKKKLELGARPAA